MLSPLRLINWAVSGHEKIKSKKHTLVRVRRWEGGHWALELLSF